MHTVIDPVILYFGTVSPPRVAECPVQLEAVLDDCIDSVKWRPLIMSFCQFFGLDPMINPSILAEIPEYKEPRHAE